MSYRRADETYVRTNGWDSCDDFSQLELVQDCGLTRCIQTNCGKKQSTNDNQNKNGMCNTANIMCTLIFTWFNIHSFHRREAICQILDRALVRWKNLAVHRYKNRKITKIQGLQKFHPMKSKAHTIYSWELTMAISVDSKQAMVE